MVIEKAQLDALKELINIGIGQAAGVLNQMTHCHIELDVPSVSLLTWEQLAGEMRPRKDELLAGVKLEFSGPFSGFSQLIFDMDSASRIAALLTGEELGSEDLEMVRVGTLSEVGNILLNGVMGSIVNMLHKRLSFRVSVYEEGTVEDFLSGMGVQLDSYVLVARTGLTIQDQLVQGEIILLFKAGSLDQLLLAVDGMISAADESE